MQKFGKTFLIISLVFVFVLIPTVVNIAVNLDIREYVNSLFVEIPSNVKKTDNSDYEEVDETKLDDPLDTDNVNYSPKEGDFVY